MSPLIWCMRSVVLSALEFQSILLVHLARLMRFTPGYSRCETCRPASQGGAGTKPHSSYRSNLYLSRADSVEQGACGPLGRIIDRQVTFCIQPTWQSPYALRQRLPLTVDFIVRLASVLDDLLHVGTGGGHDVRDASIRDRTAPKSMKEECSPGGATLRAEWVVSVP